MPNHSFSPDTDIPDLSGKVILVTGGKCAFGNTASNILRSTNQMTGTSGLGAETVKTLAKHNAAHIYLSGRNAASANVLIKQIQEAGSNSKLTFVKCDLASLSSVQAAAKEILAKKSRLDILICNAGIMATPPGTSADGYEIQFATNHLGHALLIRKLLSILLSSSTTTTPAEGTPSEDAAGGRIVILSSDMFKIHPRAGIDFDALKTTQDCGPLSSWLRYGQSKLANRFYARELSKRHPSLTAVSVHPGIVNTSLTSDMSWAKKAFVSATTFWSRVDVDEGVLNQVWAATTPKVALVNGAYYEPVGKLSKALDATAGDEALSEKLWEWTEDALKDYL